MTQKVVYKGSPLQVILDYASGNYLVYNSKLGVYVATFSSFEKAKEYAQINNQMVKRINKGFY